MGRRRVVSSALMVVLALVVAMSASACGKPSAASGKPTDERVRISGSGTCLPLLRILTRRYADEQLEFVYLPGLHSGGGIKGVLGDDLEIAAVSRELEADEAAAGLQYTPLSSDGLAIATHPSVGIKGLTSTQVRDIYQGRYRNWRHLGGPDLRIVVLDRNEAESAKQVLRARLLGPELRISPRAVSLYYETDMVGALQETPGAIGYFSLGFGLSQDVPVNYLEIDGVAPTVENVSRGAYKLARPLGVVTEKDVSPAVERFLEWAVSPEARKLIEGEGYAPAAE